MSTWQEVLKAQHDDLDRLEAMDAALNTETTELEVDKVFAKGDFTAEKFEAAVMEMSEGRGPLRAEERRAEVIIYMLVVGSRLLRYLRSNFTSTLIADQKNSDSDCTITIVVLP